MIMLKVTKAEANGWRDFMVVQWLRFYTPNARGLGSTPGQGTRPHMLQLKKRKKKKKVPHAAMQSNLFDLNLFV